MTAPDIFGPEGRFHHRKDKVNGISLHSVVGGDGPAMLFLHGWPQTWWEWRHVMPALEERHTVIAVDLRGFGDSERPAPEKGYDAATMCTDLVGLLDTLDLPSAKVVGHDLGGLVAYALARLHPARVDRLALLDTPLPLFGLEVPAWRAIEQRLWHQRFHRVPFLPEALIAGRERLYLSWHFAQTIQNVGAITSEDLDEYVRCYSQAGVHLEQVARGQNLDLDRSLRGSTARAYDEYDKARHGRLKVGGFHAARGRALSLLSRRKLRPTKAPHICRCRHRISDRPQRNETS